MEFSLGPNASTGGALARIVAEDQDNSLLGNLGRFLGRGGYAVRSLLRGKLDDAGENILQAALDLPTGGFLNRNLSLANLFSDTGDITTKEERPEFSDLIGYRGKGFDRLLLDVAGGMATDPLTFLTFGGGGLGKGALAGMARPESATKLATRLSATKAGAAALGQASDDVVRELTKGVIGGRINGLDDLLALSDEAASALANAQGTKLFGMTAGGLSPRQQALKLAEEAKRMGAERVLGASIGDDAFRITGNMAQAEALDKGIAALEKSGQLLTNSALRVGLPFQQAEKVLVNDVWGKLGGWGTAPGLAYQSLKAVSPEKAALARGAAVDLWDSLRRTYDATLSSKVPAGLQSFVQKLGYRKAAETHAKGQEIMRAFAGFDDAEKAARGMGDLLAEFEGMYHGQGRELFRARAGERLAEIDDALDLARGNLDDALNAGTVRDTGLPRGFGAQHMRERAALGRKAPAEIAALRAERKALKKGLAALERGAKGDAPDSDYVEALLGSMLGEAGRRFGPQGRTALEGYVNDMRMVQKELAESGVFKEATNNPFYIPHQINPELLEQLKAVDGLSDVRDAFTQARSFATSEEFAQRIVSLARKKGIDVDDVAGVAQDNDLRKLWLDRSVSHIRTRANRELFARAEKDFGLKRVRTSDGSWATVDSHVKTYLEGVLGTTTPDSKLFRLFAGGKQRTALDAEGLALWKSKLGGIGKADKLGRRIVKRGDQHWLETTDKGINYYVKPLLTSLNPGFHVRNWASAGLMRWFDPDTSFSAQSQIFSDFMHAAPQLPVLGGLSKFFGKNSDEIAKVVRAARDGTPEAMEAARAITVGTYTGDDVARHLGGLIGQNQTDLTKNLLEDTMRALLDGQDEVRKFFTLDPKKSILNMKDAAKAAERTGQTRAGVLYDRMVDLGTALANHTEDASRAGLYMQLLKKGHSPTEAAARVNRAFVNYATQTSQEAWLRQVIPFARFAVGSSAWLGEFARRPRLLTPWTTLRNSAESQRDEGEVLPESVRESFAIPVGEDANGKARYVTGLGLPHEAALGMLGAVSSPVGARRQVLGGMHPFLKLPAEAVTNRDFFFGDEFGAFRKAPNMLGKLGLASEVKLPEGKTRMEWPGTLREGLDALPISRIYKTFDRFFDDNRDKIGAAVQGLTGARMQTVDQERELKSAIYQYLSDKAKSGEVGEFQTWTSRFAPEDTPEDLKIVLQGLRDLRTKRAKERKKRKERGR